MNWPDCSSDGNSLDFLLQCIVKDDVSRNPSTCLTQISERIKSVLQYSPADMLQNAFQILQNLLSAEV